jgi:amino acid adenylation domain-containing protein
VARLANQTDLVIGTPVAGRGRAELEGLIGLFVNTLALRIDLGDAPTVAGLLARVRELALAAQQHQETPFEQVVEALNPERSLAHSPLFQLMFAWQNTPPALPALAGLEAEPLSAPVRSAPFDLTLELREEGELIRGQFSYATALFDAATIERHGRCLVQLLRGLVTAADEQPVAALELLDGAERRRVLHDFNRTAVPVPEQLLFHQLVEPQAARTPHARAIEAIDGQLSYAELNQRANQLAHYLISAGVKPDDRVAILLPRGSDMIIAILAVLKAGGGYVPLDPAYPRQRLLHMLEDSAPVLLISQLSLPCRLDTGPGRPTLLLDADAERWARCPAADPAVPGLSPDHLAYVIYTSGSTGLPKGVAVSHRNLCNLVLASSGVFALEPHSRVLQFASPSFDACVWEVAMTLSHGACLCIPESRGLAGEPLCAELRRARISHALLPPVVLAGASPAALDELVTLVVGGDALPEVEARRWSQGRRLINAYGPTEATVYASLHPCAADATGAPPIGRPIANTRIYLLDGQGQPVPIGVAGEIHIGGAGVARGYLNRPELTGERFIPDPFSDQPGARLYRSGDLGRWREDGVLEYLGRNDDQLKLRGFRIEPGEIEAQLTRLPGVRQAVVQARGEGADRQLVAWLVGEGLALPALRRQLAAVLPEHMIPAAFVTLPALPLTPNGKLDRAALPAPDEGAIARAEYEAPRGELEIELAALWQRLLKREGIGRHDNFFELGGHSLMLLEMTADLARRGIELHPGEIFRHPQLAALADHIHRNGSAREGAIEVRPGRGIPLFLVHEYSGLDLYFTPLATSIGHPAPIFGLAGVPLSQPQLAAMPLLAGRLLAQLRAVQPTGPYRLAGWSFGGALAYELCCQLRAAGECIAFAGLIDSWHPALLADHLTERLAAPTGERLLQLCADAGADRQRIERLRQGAANADFDALFAHCDRLGLLPSYLAGRDSRQLQAHLARLSAHDRALAAYRPPVADFNVHLFKAGQAMPGAPVAPPEDNCLGWSGCIDVDRRRVITLPGTHQSLMDSHIDLLGAAISAALACAG